MATKRDIEGRKMAVQGFFYVAFDFVMKYLHFLNVSKWFNVLARKIWKHFFPSVDSELVRNNAIDLFTLLKIIFVVVAILYWQGEFLTGVVIYLLIMNLYTYFRYHIWTPPQEQSVHIAKRYFLSLIWAIIFNILCFVYLYYKGYASQLVWNLARSITLQDIVCYSISKTFILNPPCELTNGFGYHLQLTQQIISYLFLVIILSQSIPRKVNNDTDAKK